ncbi:MAG: hypothetical protein ABL949_00690 [Fimbriimonadaceae bacterium]
MISALALGVTIFQTSAPLGASRAVAGVMLVTSDPAQINRLKAEFKQDDLQSSYEKRYPGDKFKLIEWGKRSLIIVDKAIQMVSTKLDSLNTLKVLQKYGSEGTIRFSQLSSEEAKALTTTLSRAFPFMYLQNPTPDFEFGPSISTTFFVEGADGQVKNVGVSSDSDARHRSMVDKLVAAPFSSGKELASPEDQQKRYDALRSAALEAQGFRVQHFGIAQLHSGDGMRLLGEKFETMLKEIDQEIANEVKSVLAKLEKSDLRKEDTFTSLPKDTARKIEGAIMSNYKELGFADRESARRFLQSSRRISGESDISILVHVKGKEGRNLSGAYVGRTPGYILP